MFLPNCPCCRPPGCRCGELPHTVTLKFSGFPATAGGDGITVAAGSNCIGFGAVIAARRVGLGVSDEDDPIPEGPISSPMILNPGKCYAARDWVMPNLAAFGSGKGAVFDVVMERHPTDSCGRPRWRIASISVAGGTGYANNSLLTILPAAGDVAETAAVATVQSVGGVPQSVTIQNQGIYYRPTTGDRDVPIVTATVGGGAKLGVALERLDGDPAEWQVSYVSVLLPGSGLSTGQAVTFSTGDRTTQSAAATATLVADDAGNAVAVTLTQGGRYYRDTDLPAIVFEPIFTIGSAVVRGLVDADFDSETFGQVVSLAMQNPGSVDGYREFPIGNSALNGGSRVVVADNSESLVTPCVSSCHGSGALLETVGHVAPSLLAFLEGGGKFPPGASVFYDVSVEQIPGTAPKLWRVSKLEFTGFSFPGADPGQNIIIQPVGGTTQVAAATAVLDANLDPVITNQGQFFNQDRVWDGVPGPLTGIRLLSGGSGYALQGRLEPTLAADAFGTSTMAVSLSQKADDCNIPYWEVEEIEPAGTNVTDRRVARIFLGPNDTEEVGALAVVSTRQQPTVVATPPEQPETEQAAVFAVTLEKTDMFIPSRASLLRGAVANDVVPAFWSVANIEIVEPGLGYPTLTRLDIEVTAGTATKPAAALAFANALGEIENVVVETGGEYFLDNRVVQEVKIAQAGKYYREDSSLPPYVSTPIVSLTQIAPSNGNGAVINLKVETDTSSNRFGEIISATIPQGQGGTGYHMRSGARPNAQGVVQWQGSGIVLTASPEGLRAIAGRSVSSDTDIPDPESLYFDVANKRSGVNCTDWFTNPLTPVTRTTAGSITAVPGGAYTP